MEMVSNKYAKKLWIIVIIIIIVMNILLESLSM